MTMPAGKYWVGDLCYVMHAEWSEACNLFFKDRTDSGCNEGEFTLEDGRRFVSFNTKWGDGCYRDQTGLEYNVDAGLIGCINLNDIDVTNIDNIVDGGHIHEFHSEFDCEGGRNAKGHGWHGTIRIGKVLIDTDSYEEYETEEEEEEEE